ncbi:hypothetical protein HDE69_004818 [Pedobacter cryoconitis]|uniref:Uncharacterized protein n=1 Tax=Pedobacter cryoconitis TaxID=188932 RepID=A0A7W8YXQ0_9SPHI|nr:hypothetical protein [Pedobacter cryoconitis]
MKGEYKGDSIFHNPDVLYAPLWSLTFRVSGKKQKPANQMIAGFYTF